MSKEIPEGWVLAQISDISFKCIQRKPDFTEEFTYIDIGSINRELKRIESPKLIRGDEAPSRARKVINKGDVLVSLTRPNLNAVALVSDKYDKQIASTGFEVIKPVMVDNRYVFALTRAKHFIDSISGLVQGALYPAAKSSDVQKYSFFLPPLAEQKVIADKLDELLTQVDKNKIRINAIPAILKSFRQSVLTAAVTGKLTKEWRKTNQTENISVLVKRNNELKSGKLKIRAKKEKQDFLLYDLPESWAWLSNHELAEDNNTAICAGPFGTIFKAKYFREQGIPIIFLRHVKEGKFNQVNPNFMDTDIWKDLHQEYSVHGGELLVTKLGNPPGEACIYPIDEGTAMVTPDVIKMNVDIAVAEPAYLMHFFNSPIAKEIVKGLAFGATRLRIDIAMFKNFPIPLASRSEQIEIVRLITQLFDYADKVELQAQDALAQVNKLPQSILEKALSGRLTETWRKKHPELITGENSAETLLNKIIVEKEKRVLLNRCKTKDIKMKKINLDSVRSWIDLQPNNFTFEQLSQDFNGDYNAIKDIVFSLLQENGPSIVQEFNSTKREIVFRKIS
jgi:type I restriction enzyme S subunit